MAPRQSLPPPGAVMGGRYRLTHVVATGGMGAVYEAVDEKLQRRVALKLLHPDLTTDRDVRRRFRRESSVLRALDHPCIVRILDVGADDEGDGFLFSVMELLEGETLLARIERVEHLTPMELAPIVGGIASGLSAAHAHGVIHGDLKPANVFLTSESVKLLDFGLSKVLGLERLTQTGELIGTPAYMAPELLTGKGELDERIDTYSFGVLMYQSLCGRAPFEGKVPGKLMMDIVMGQAPALRDLRADIDEAVESVVRRAMSRQREERFPSADALAQAFASAVG